MTDESANGNTRQPNESVLLRDDRGPIAVLTLNRPEARNCLNEELLTALASEIEDIADSTTTKVVIINANGPVFSSGHDIKQLEEHRSDPDGGRAYFEKTFALCTKMMTSIVKCPKPVIAAIEGVATAAGTQLLATCDLAVCATDSKFCTPGVHIGLFCSTPMVALSRNVGRKKAMEMLLLGEMMEAEDAVTYGLVNRAVAPGAAMSEALSMAETIAGKSAKTISIGKSTFYRQVEEPLGEAYETASQVMTANMMTADAEEGLDAFLAKRKPHWTDA